MWFSLFGSSRDEDAERALERYIEKSQKPLGLISFTAIFTYKLDLAKYFSGTSVQEAIRRAAIKISSGDIDPLKSFLLDHGIETFLAVVTYLWWYQFNTAVKNEKKLIADTYTKMNIRKRVGSIIGYRLIPYIGVGATLTFLLLAFFIDNLPMYCVFMIMLNMIDIWGNNTVRTNMTEDFWKKKFAPPEGDPHRAYVVRRAEVLEEYWIKKPQLQRIGLMMICASSALIVSFSEQVAGVYVPVTLPYLIVITCILVNGHVMRSWRKVRDDALRVIDFEEDQEFGKRID